MTGTVCFERKKTNICNAKFGDLEISLMGVRVKVCVEIAIFESPILLIPCATFLWGYDYDDD